MYQMGVENISKVQIKLLHMLSFRSFALAFSYRILDVQTNSKHLEVPINLLFLSWPLVSREIIPQPLSLICVFTAAFVSTFFRTLVSVSDVNS